MGWRDALVLMGLSLALVAVAAVYLYFENSASPSLTAADRAALEEFSIYMHRKGCVDQCASYAVLAKGSGELEFEGVANVGVIGGAQASVDQAQMEQLYIAVFQSGLLQMSTDLVQGMTGCHNAEQGGDRITFGVTLGDTTRVMSYYTRCEEPRPELDRLARRIDDLLDTERWTEVASAGVGG